MPADQESNPARVEEGWSGDFRAAEDRLLDASLAATPSQRLKWLEDALTFAADFLNSDK